MTFINTDILHSPCYHPLQKVWSVKIGYRKFEFRSKKAAEKFHHKYCDRLSKIPKKDKNEVYCSDQPPEGLSYKKLEAKRSYDAAKEIGIC